MRSSFPAFLLVSFAALSTAAPAQDMNVRVEAIRLIDRAYSVSSTTNPLPDYKQEVTFRAYSPDGTAKDGAYNVIFSGTTERSELIFGDYHLINFQTPEKTLKTTSAPLPVEAMQMLKLVPLTIGRFDESDTIHSITPATVAGRPANCIHFETVTGKSTHTNEICLDTEQGTVLRWDVNGELVEDSDYYIFEGVPRPAHIRLYIAGKLRMDIDQKLTLIKEPIDWAALTPQNAQTYVPCQKYDRPLIQSAQQPANAGPGPWYNVKVHGSIGLDGKVHEATAVEAGRPDLEREAIKIVSQWTFTPAMCDGRPAPTNDATLTVHFPPQ
jgi:Gram-negative bacterial TonB protein C-terminal